MIKIILIIDSSDNNGNSRKRTAGRSPRGPSPKAEGRRRGTSYRSMHCRMKYSVLYCSMSYVMYHVLYHLMH